MALPVNGSAGVAGIDTATIKNLSFNGSASVTIPPGGIIYSDPVDFHVSPLSNIALTIYSQAGQAGNKITGHPGSRTTSWMEAGNKVVASSITEMTSVEHWYFASAIEAWAPKSNSGLVILGDSITDGRGSDDNQNNR